MLRKIKIVIVISLVGMFFQGCGLSKVEAIDKSSFLKEVDSSKNEMVQKTVPGEIMVKFVPGRINLSNPSLISRMLQMGFEYSNDLKDQGKLDKGNIVIYKIKSQQKVDDIIAELRDDPNVEYAEPNYVLKLSSIPTNDTYKTSLWGLDNTGQTVTDSLSGSTQVGTVDADIDFPEAMAVSTGVTDVIVAVIDTGVAYNHPDLAANMWDGTNCKDENGNTLGGCLYGYDFADNDNDPTPHTSSHGTHVSGTIAAIYNNDKGIMGYGTHVKIMALRCGDDSLSSSCIIKSIDFARENGAKVINASYGGEFFTQSEYDAIARFRDAGGILVAAAGNESLNNEITHSYPSDYNLLNIISVVATDSDDELASYSNYGSVSTDVGAPGTFVMSTSSKYSVYQESFENVSSGLIPGLWSASGDAATAWGVLGSTDKALFTDYQHTTVAANANNYVESGTLDLSGYTGDVSIGFNSTCWTGDTDPTLGGDYAALEISSDGTSFSEIIRWNEYSLTQDFGTYYGGLETTLTSQYLTVNFKFRLKWMTGSSPTGSGCAVDDVSVVSNNNDGLHEGYEFKKGTSMATPHVAGLAGYLWSVSPTSTTSNIISAIINSGDSLSSLSGKTVSGKRINAFNSVTEIMTITPTPTPTITPTLVPTAIPTIGETITPTLVPTAIPTIGETITPTLVPTVVPTAIPTIGTTTVPTGNGPVISGLVNDSIPALNKSWVWSSDDSEAVYRFSVDQSLDGVPTGIYGTGTSTVYTSGEGTYYLHVQGKSVSQIEGPVKTVSFVMDHLGPQASLNVSVGETDSFSLTLDEDLYSSLGVGLSAGTRLDSQLVASQGITINTVEYGGQNRIITFYISGMTMGSRLSIGSSASSKLYDNLGNSSSLFLVYNGEYWQLNPTVIDLPIIGVGISQLVGNDLISVEVGTTEGQDLSVTVLENISIGATGLGVVNSVTLPINTQITELNDLEFNSSELQINNLAPNELSGFSSDFSVVSAVQWGIPGTTLKFSIPITIKVYVGSINDGKTLNVFRSAVNNGSWTIDGLVDTTCLVANGYCQFETNQASYYSVASFEPSAPAPTNTPSQDNNSNNNGGGSSPGAPMCNDVSPTQVADLFKIKTEKGNAKLYYTPVEGASGYAVIYGHKKGDERFGTFTDVINNNEGEQNVTIGNLKTNQKYYFKVVAFKGCTSGPWSEWVPAKANRKATIDKYKKINLGKGLYKLISRFV